MKTLPTAFTHHGRTLKQLQRSATVAIYELIGSQGLTYGYEVIRIKIKPEQLVFEKLVPEREAYPSDSDFGRIAWSFGRNYKKEAFELYEVFARVERQSLLVRDPSAFQRALMQEQPACN